MAESDIVSQRLGKIGKALWYSVAAVGCYFLFSDGVPVMFGEKKSCVVTEEYRKFLLEPGYLVKKAGFKYTFDEESVMQSGSVRYLFEIQRVEGGVHQSLQVRDVKQY